ncbi:hypothetical protein FOH10_34395 [Nocardia otitidiscaviarum]|uniref:Uncharacterized protein n=1 Tax=Nocardia otitidiscaviarum TaxID=1823 RepID=A0A516NVX3_9NOCA|nr:hypothetical protein [Nocardia otitidiscaviarum]MCP9622557.1 hypothetical protein [Nocardia otitidiscaviarum]QDP83057.1 hypothetical protein FOH10_34395 [Nocardia otitidiscaviarum]
MSDDFAFWVDTRAAEYFREIIREMVESYEISESEAIARINERFIGLVFTGENIIYHEPESYWARDIIFGHDVWWKDSESISRIPPPMRWQRWLHRRLWWQQWCKLQRTRWSSKMRRRHR